MGECRNRMKDFKGSLGREDGAGREGLDVVAR